MLVGPGVMGVSVAVRVTVAVLVLVEVAVFVAVAVFAAGCVGWVSPLRPRRCGSVESSPGWLLS